MHDYYEINVSKNGKHFFATAPRSLIYSKDAESAFNLFKEKFPESEGYKVGVYHWKSAGHRPDFAKED